MDPTTTDTASELDAAAARLGELETKLAKGATDTRKGASATDAAGTRAPAPVKPAGSTPPDKTQPQASTPSAADTEKAELDAAQKEAEAEGKEIALDDKGKPARDAGGKFVKKDKAGQATDPDKAAADPLKAADKSSKYAQDKARRDDSWRALNTEKDKFKAEREKTEAQLKAARDQFDADVRAHQQRQQEAQASQTPEAYDKMSVAEAQKAAKLDEMAKVAEANGDFEKADYLRESALIAKGFQKLAAQKAADLRANPPPNAKQMAEANAAQMKEWTLKGATDFPEFGKKDSPVQKAAVDFLKIVGTQFPQFRNVPQLVYFAAQYGAAKAAADRVPALEKELGELRSKVTELEALTNPTPEGGHGRLPGEKSFTEMTPAQQLAQLHADAARLG